MSKNTDHELSNEFKEEIKKERKHNKKNIFGTILAFLAIILIFGTIGIAVYQLIEKPETTENKSAADKIISKPAEDKKAATPTPATTPAASTPAATTPTTTDYTVKAGDTWSSVANANGMTSSALMKANNTTSEDLQIGQVIKIPKS